MLCGAIDLILWQIVIPMRLIHSATRDDCDPALSGYLLYPVAFLEVTNTGSKRRAKGLSDRERYNGSFSIVPSSLSFLCLQLSCHYCGYTTTCFDFGYTFHSNILWCTDSTKKLGVMPFMF